MSTKTLHEQTLVINVPRNQETVTVRLELETSCNCTPQVAVAAGSYTDSEPLRR